jgi:hypothetical protein
VGAGEFEVRRKVKLTQGISTFSKKAGWLRKGQLVQVREFGSFNGGERAFPHLMRPFWLGFAYMLRVLVME